VTAHVVHDQTGNAVSIGTRVADPLPDHLAAAVVSDADYARLRDGTGRWDPATLTVVDVPPNPDPKAELLAALDAAPLLMDDLRDVVRQAIEQGVV
jgi:hypothetical protein